MADTGLEHFLAAQNPIYDVVVAELAAGRKQSHWMWFIFPQLQGLGRSPTAHRFGLTDLHHARRYIGHPILGRRLRECVQLMLKHKGQTARFILGSPDDLKFRSCLTLFANAADDPEDQRLFLHALETFYRGQPDPLTIDMIDPA